MRVRVTSFARIALPLGLFAACASSGVRRGERAVEKVEIVGNDSFRDRTITNKLATRPPSGLVFRRRVEFDALAVELDRERIVAFYRERGFFAARVVDVDVKYLGESGAEVRIVVEEGEPTRVAAVRVEGAPLGVDGVALGAAQGLERGVVFEHPDYLSTKERLRQELLDRGYAHARVDGTVEIDRDARRAVVKLRVDPGPLVRFGELRVEGLRSIPESAVRARVSWDPGDRFDPRAIDRTQGSLYRLGAFSLVRIDYEKQGRPQVADVTIRVSEATRHEVRLGFGLGVERQRTEIHGRAGYSVRGLLHPLTTLRLEARPGYTVRGQTAGPAWNLEARATLEQEDFLVPLLRAAATAAYEVEPFEGYSYRGPRGTVALDRALWIEALKLRVDWTVRSLTFFDVDPALIAAGWDLEGYRVGHFGQSLIFDGRDRPIDARRGVYASIELEEGGAFAGGKFDFLRVTPELRGYVPLGERVVIAGRARVGRLVSPGGSQSPITRRFYGGGAAGHRGFGYRRLSPMLRAADGSSIPIGGDELVETSVEARVELVRFRAQWVSVAAFLDAGDVTRAGELSFADLHWAAGVGLRWDTPIGPLRFDVGYRLNRVDGPGDPDPGERTAFHLSIGEAF